MTSNKLNFIIAKGKYTFCRGEKDRKKTTCLDNKTERTSRSVGNGGRPAPNETEATVPFCQFFKFNKASFISGKLGPFSIVRCSSSSSAAATSIVAGGRNRRSSSSPTSTSDREAIRMNKELRSKGLDSYAYKWEPTHTENELQEIYRNLGNGEELTGESDNVSIAGRIVVHWTLGKLAFLTLRDDSGTIQLYCEKERLLSDQFEHLKTLVDIGDILGARGSISALKKIVSFSSFAGELSVCGFILNPYEILSAST